MADCLEHYLSLARGILECKASAVQGKIQFDQKYVLTPNDIKDRKTSYDTAIASCDAELKLVKEAARGWLAKSNYNHYSTRLSVTQIIPSTVTSGVCNSVVAINANGITDFSAFASLFDVYRIRGGHYQFQFGFLGSSTNSTPANTGSATFVFAYDVNSTAASNPGTLADDAQARVYFMPVAITYGGSNLVLGQLNKLHSYKWKTTPGVIDSASTSPPIQGEGDWCLTSDTTSAYGYLKPYGIFGAAGVIANAVNGILTNDFEFRMRV